MGNTGLHNTGYRIDISRGINLTREDIYLNALIPKFRIKRHLEGNTYPEWYLVSIKVINGRTISSFNYHIFR